MTNENQDRPRTSVSYDPQACCGAECYMLGCIDNQPCWGNVEAIDEQCTEDYSDCWWVHACQGHLQVYGGGKYTPEPEVI